MSQASDQQWATEFRVLNQAGDARAGMLEVNGTAIATPNLFPVINMYAGGMQRSVFGGGVHRTMKEFMIGAERIGGGDYREYFDGLMTSVASLTDYNISRERYEDYLAEPIKEREPFTQYDGVIFIDSGGFKFLDGGELDGADFEVDIDQKEAYRIQERMGGDIIVNLDRPIARDDDYETRVKKAKQTAENIAEFLTLADSYDGACFLTLHGYNYSMMETFTQIVINRVGRKQLVSSFDGVALGSLVPFKDNKGALIDAVQDCRELLCDYGMRELPLHVLGISSTAIPLLAAVGADSFDSSTYLMSAVNAKYCTGLAETVSVHDADFSQCDCPVCSDPELVSWMNGNAEYQKDMLGAVAMHNLILQKREIDRIQAAIRTGDPSNLVEYIDEAFGDNKRLRDHAHRVVNESLGGYF